MLTSRDGRTSPRPRSCCPDRSRRATIACGSSPRPARWSSPGTQPSAHATPGLRRGGAARLDGSSCRNAGSDWSQVRRTDGGLAFAAPALRRSGPRRRTHWLARIAAQLGSRPRTSWPPTGSTTERGGRASCSRTPRPSWACGPARSIWTSGWSVLIRTGGPADFEVRAFFPKHGATAEDPVTGSLNAGLAQWLIAEGRARPPYEVRQGTALGHEGRVSVFEADGRCGSAAPRARSSAGPWRWPAGNPCAAGCPGSAGRTTDDGNARRTAAAKGGRGVGPDWSRWSATLR